MWRVKHLLVAFAASCSLVALSSGLSAHGQEYDDIKTLGLGSRRTIVVVFGAGCEPCKASIPFYKRLLELEGMDGKAGRVVMMSVDGVVPVNEVLKSAGLKPHHLVSFPRRFPYRELSDEAPELVILDGSGTPLGKWRGRLTPEQESAVLEAAQ